MNVNTLRAIIIEDTEEDAILVERALRRAGYDLVVARVQDRKTLEAALARSPWDVVISDYTMPGFSALDALRMVKGTLGDVPFIIVSGSIGEESAVEALKSGAGDFIVKTNLDRLLTALERELRDVQTRRERRDAIEALKEEVRARDDFLAIASHELRTPLTSLQLQLQRLGRALGVTDEAADAAMTAPQQPLSAEGLRGRYRAISRSAHRMQVLVERLLDVTRLTSRGRVDLLMDDSVDLAQIARDSVRRALAGPAPSPPVPVTLRAPEPVVGRWDRQRIDMIVSNLIDNALKYANGKPVEIVVEAVARTARVVVIDHGLGIPVEAQRRIFERFERAVPVRHFGGFGLGLWLARQIAEAHGGEITVKSTPGEGSTFTLELPRESPPARDVLSPG